MRLWLILLNALIISGCASEPLQLPQFQEAERSDEDVTYPTEYPILCEIPDWDTSCWQSFVAFEEVAVNNFDLAIINAQIAEDSDKAYDHILNAAKSQQQIGQIREDMLAEERKDHFLDNLWHRAVILVGVLAAIL